MDNVTTAEEPHKAAHDGGLERWVRQGRHDEGRPRRGKRPEAPLPAAAPPEPLPASAAQHVPGAAPQVVVPADSPPEPPASALPQPALPLPRGLSGVSVARANNTLKRLLAGAAGLVLAGMVGLMVALPEPRQQAPVTGLAQPVAWEVGAGWKVAPPWRPPDTATGSQVPTATAKEGAPVENAQQKKAAQKKAAGALTKAAVTGCLVGAVGCSAPALQVRPQPAPEACPKGAVEGMAKLGITPGSVGEGATFNLHRSAEIISVKEGWTTIWLYSHFKKLPQDTRLSGRLIFGDRVYGRFTQATLPPEDGGGTVPVCFELLDTGDDRGLEYRPGSTESEAKVITSGGVKAVDRFE